MLYVREMAEKFFIVTDVYIFMLLYLECTYRDKEFFIVIHMTLEHVLVQRSKKIEMNEKSNF